MQMIVILNIYSLLNNCRNLYSLGNFSKDRIPQILTMNFLS